METVPISHLGPSLSNPESQRIRAIVSLIWPYSSSTKSVGLLLVEPDFRLREKKGQVRVQLQGASAAALGRTKIGIGDEILLHLEDAQWVEATPGISTPGKSVDMELLFKRRLICQILRDGHEHASLDIVDNAISDRSRSPSLSTPIEPFFAYGTPSLSRLNGLSTPASSAFHKRARVSGGSLVDSPYDPFVMQARRAGEPQRKKARHSWGIEARWTVDRDAPSPTKKNRTIDWIQDEDLLSPKKQPQKAIAVGEPQSPISEPSPTAAKAIDSQLDQMRVQYTQELVNLISGDTEEDSDNEVLQPAASPDPERMSRAESYESPLRQSFSVFRDFSIAETTGPIRQDIDFDAEEFPNFNAPLDEASLQGDEDQFINMLSTENHEVLDDVEEDPDHTAWDDRSSSLPQQDINLLARESFEGEQVERESPARTSPPARASLARESPAREYPSRQELEPEDDVDPSLQVFTAPISTMGPPSLPLIQTSNFGSGQGTPMLPPSALPRSPRTPDLRPQQSATLPLPSPFPGDDLATFHMDSSSDWQPSAGFTTPLQRSLPDFGFGFGFRSDGLNRRYSTEADLHLADSSAVVRAEEAVLSSQVSDENEVPELPANEFQLSSTNEQSSAQALAKVVDAKMDITEEVDDGSFQSRILQNPELRTSEEIHSHAYQTVTSQGEDVLASPYFHASEIPSSDSAMPHEATPKTELATSGENQENKEGEEEGRHHDLHNKEDEQEEYSEEDNEDKEEEAEEEEDDNDKEVAVRVRTGYRFGPQLNETMAPPALTPVFIDLLSDSDDESSEEEESELESVDGDEEDAQFAQADLIDDEAVEHSTSEEEEEDESELESAEDDEDDESDMDDEDDKNDEDEIGVSGPEEGDDPDQGSRMHPLEPSSIQLVPAFDGNDDPHSTTSAPVLMSKNSFPSSMPALMASPFVTEATHVRFPSSTAPLPQVTKAVVIDIGSDDESEDESETMTSPTVLPVIKHELAHRTEIADTHQPVRVQDESMEDHAPAEATDVYMEDEDNLPSQSEQQESPSTEPKHEFGDLREPDGIQVESQPSARRPVVKFAPHVSRRRAAGHSQLTTQLELHSSQPLASSQDSSRRPKLIIQDTFEGMAHSDGSVTTAAPSSPIQGSVEASEEDAAQPISSPPVRISDDRLDESQVLYPALHKDPKGEALEHQHFLSRSKSRPQQSMAESTLVTPDASQLTHFQHSFANVEEEGALPLTPQLTQRTSNASITTLDNINDGQYFYKDAVEESNQLSQTLLANRFDSQGVQHFEQDLLPFSQLDGANGEDAVLPLVEYESIKLQPVKDVYRGEADNHLSSQLPTNFSFSQLQSSQTKGLLTSLSYYTPLSNLMTRLSTRSSQSYNDNGVDIIAVVTKSSTKPLRAEKGPKDYGTNFLISDQDFWPQKVHVKVFRPWKLALPVVDHGDIILLRGFDVLPQKGDVAIGLKSGEGSAWCVWRFGAKAEDNDLFSDDVPIWVQKEKQGDEPTLEEREDVRGPPVERGTDERGFVRDLREWWVNRRKVMD